MLRLTGLLLALSGVLVAPGLAVAHGLAHHHATSEHHELSSAAVADDHEHEHDSADHTTGATDSASIAVGQSGGHAHLHVDAALASKSSVQPVALLAPALAVPDASTRERMPVRCRATVERRANLAHAPPPRLRSPPANS